MNLLILVQSGFGLWNPPKWFAELLRKDFPQVEVTQRDTSDDSDPYLRDADVDLVAKRLATRRCN